jgi:GTP 3',8-cyclase
LIPAGTGFRERQVPCAEIRKRIEAHWQLEPVSGSSVDADGESVFQLPNAVGRIGFISPVSDNFCAHCNRVRLIPDGKLRGCLMQEGEVDLREALRLNASDARISDLIREALRRKPERHLINSSDFVRSKHYTMNRLGG